MIDYSQITAAIKSILEAELDSTYLITRNEERNVNPNLPQRKGKYINISRGSVSYTAHVIGNTPWLVTVRPKIEIQVASMISGENAEDILQDAEKAVLDVLTANKKLNNTVAMTNGYDIEYEYNANEQIYHHASIITIIAECRSG